MLPQNGEQLSGQSNLMLNVNALWFHELFSHHLGVLPIVDRNLFLYQDEKIHKAHDRHEYQYQSFHVRDVPEQPIQVNLLAMDFLVPFYRT